MVGDLKSKLAQTTSSSKLSDSAAALTDSSALLRKMTDAQATGKAANPFAAALAAGAAATAKAGGGAPLVAAAAKHDCVFQENVDYQDPGESVDCASNCDNRNLRVSPISLHHIDSTTHQQCTYTGVIVLFQPLQQTNIFWRF